MAQNIYDDEQFFAGYSAIPRSRLGLAGAPEWPALRAMLPDVAGLRILDLGCGFGAFDRWAIEQGAHSVVAVDVSERMLAEAERRGPGFPVTYQRADLESFVPAPASADLVYSTLAVHYLADFPGLCARVRAALVPGGHFVFTVEHPLFAARAEPEWATDSAGVRVALVRDYNVEGERRTDWIASGVVKYHRKISTMVKALAGAGFQLVDLDEWAPTQDQLADEPDLEEILIRPMLLLVSARAGIT